jgi:hypothetical protein
MEIWCVDACMVYWHVNDDDEVDVERDTPKSVMQICPSSVSKMFSGLRSLYNTALACKYSKPHTCIESIKTISVIKKKEKLIILRI